MTSSLQSIGDRCAKMSDMCPEGGHVSFSRVTGIIAFLCATAKLISCFRSAEVKNCDVTQAMRTEQCRMVSSVLADDIEQVKPPS